MSRQARKGVHSVLSTAPATPSTSIVHKECVYEGCTFATTGADGKLVVHSMGSHVSNCHGKQTVIWYGAKQITIERDAKTQEMRCLCGYSHINSSYVRKHAMKEHKANGPKTATLARRESSQPIPSVSRPGPELVSSIETSSSIRSVSPIENSDTPPTSHTSGGLSLDRKQSKSLPRLPQFLVGKKRQRMSPGTEEQRLSKPVVPQTTGMREASASATKTLAGRTLMDTSSRSYVSNTRTTAVGRPHARIPTSTSGASQRMSSHEVPQAPMSSSSLGAKGKSAHADRVPTIAKPSIGHLSGQLDFGSIGRKRPLVSLHAGLKTQPKARKTSRHSDASSSRKILPALESEPNSTDEGSLSSPAESASTLLSKPQMQCTRCHRALEPLQTRWKTCDRCREKQRDYLRRRREGAEDKVSLLLPSVSVPRPKAPARAHASSLEDETMGDNETHASVMIATHASTYWSPATSHSVWDEVPEFQSEYDFLAAVRRAVLAWRTHAHTGNKVNAPAHFEFCGGYAVVAGSAEADHAVAQRLSGKLVSKGVPMTKHPCFNKVTNGGCPSKHNAYHVHNSVSTVFYCTCRDDRARTSAAKIMENVCRGRIKVVVEATNEKHELGAFGQNVVFETLHAW